MSAPDWMKESYGTLDFALELIEILHLWSTSW